MRNRIVTSRAVASWRRSQLNLFFLPHLFRFLVVLHVDLQYFNLFILIEMNHNTNMIQADQKSIIEIGLVSVLRVMITCYHPFLKSILNKQFLRHSVRLHTYILDYFKSYLKSV